MDRSNSKANIKDKNLNFDDDQLNSIKRNLDKDDFNLINYLVDNEYSRLMLIEDELKRCFKPYEIWGKKFRPNIQSRYIKRLYNALVTLLIRFHHDWVSDNIDKSKVLIIRYDKMMSNFEIVMSDIFSFLDHSPSKKLINDIQKTAKKQRTYKSKHNYNLKKFGLSEKKIKKDCLSIYETFLKL